MKVPQIYILIAFSLLIVSCDTKPAPDKTILHEFFFEIDKVPAVLVYKIQEDKNYNLMYYHLSSPRTNILEVRKYDDAFILNQHMQYSYEKKGVYLQELKFFSSLEQKMIKKEILEGFVFPLENIEDNMHIRDYFMSSHDSTEYLRDFSWSMDRIETKTIANMDVPTIIFNGNIELYIGHSANTDTLRFSEEIWYSEGIGLSYIRSSSDIWGDFTQSYLGTISIEEFEEEKEIFLTDTLSL